MPQEQEQGEAEGEGAAHEEFAVYGAPDQKRLIDAECLCEEMSGGVKNYVQHKDVAGFELLREATGHPEQDQARE